MDYDHGEQVPQCVANRRISVDERLQFEAAKREAAQMRGLVAEYAALNERHAMALEMLGEKEEERLLLEDEVAEDALLVLGNLCSDAVDPASHLTKRILLRCRPSAESALLDGTYSDDPAVVLLACAALQNLCQDEAWARAVISCGFLPRLDQLVRHEDTKVVRYVAGALQNLVAKLHARVAVAAAEQACEDGNDAGGAGMLRPGLRQSCQPQQHALVPTVEPPWSPGVPVGAASAGGGW